MGGTAPAIRRHQARLRRRNVHDVRTVGKHLVVDVQGGVLVVSQFTLYANTKKGHRPSYVKAAPPAIASPLVDQFVAMMNEAGVPTQSGIFGAHMMLDIVNDGPVTIVMER